MFSKIRFSIWLACDSFLLPSVFSRWMADTIWPPRDRQGSILPGQPELSIGGHDEVCPVSSPPSAWSRTRCTGNGRFTFVTEIYCLSVKSCSTWNEWNTKRIVLFHPGCQFCLQRKQQLLSCCAFSRARKRVICAYQTEHLRPLQTSTSGENNAGQLTQGEATVPPGARRSPDQHG